MSRIRGKDTKVERELRRALWSRGLHFRLHHPVFGRPDLAFVKEKVAVFVDGCFWHRCPMHYVKPATRKAFWAAKIAGNVRRDRLVTRNLRTKRWQVLRFWEHELERDITRIADRIQFTVRRKR
jgi:DNA mismatch endonuclease (patch repair protein)